MPRIALLQNRATADPAENLAGTIESLREAAAAGAQIICTQEMCTTLYFCRDQDSAHFDLAEPMPGPATQAFQKAAAEAGVVVVAAAFERRAPGLHHNTAAIIDADGALLGLYRKMHIPQDPGFEEKFYFTPGDTGYRAWRTRFGTIGVLICWDQWFPEAARLTAMQGAHILFYPTAIGWLPEEKQALGERQHSAWETVQRGHAIANGCYVAAANRTGTEGHTEFWGRSFVADYCGEVTARAATAEERILYADCDFAAMEEHRRMWPFFRDRRIDSYQGLLQRWGTAADHPSQP